MIERHRAALVTGLVALVAICDQATKRIASDTLRFSLPQSYLDGLFRLQYSENPGGFLSFGAGLPGDVRTWLFKWAVGILLTGALAFALLDRQVRTVTTIGLALFIGGGFSNLADRVFRGDLVVDFMNVGIGRLRTGVFNVADLSIVVGLVVLLVGSLLGQGSSTRYS